MERETYKCQSYYDDYNILMNCTCGKCADNSCATHGTDKKNRDEEVEKIREANASQGWRNRLEERHDDRMRRYGKDIFQ